MDSRLAALFACAGLGCAAGLLVAVAQPPVPGEAPEAADGPTTEPGKNGTSWVGSKKAGKWDGVVEVFDSDGKRIYEKSYKAGKESGPHKEWAPKTGQQLVEMTLADGLPQGLVLTWYEDGTPSSEGYYAAGQPVGLHQVWHPSGALASQRNYGAGLEQTWDEGGALTYSGPIYPEVAP